MAKRCANCRHVYDDRDPDDSMPDPIYRCGYPVPFWVPVQTYDYTSWVKADDGAKCSTFDKRPKKS